MKTVVIFASTPKSHIIPIEPLVIFLKVKGFKVHCFSCKENKRRILDMDMIFHEYPKDIFREIGQKKDLSFLKAIGELWVKGKYMEGYTMFLEEDTRQMYNIIPDKIEEMNGILNTIKPDIIFRDSADKVGYYLEKRLSIPVVGYITNNLYSELFFNQDPLHLYSLLLNLNKIDSNAINTDEIKSFFKTYREKLFSINEQIAQSLNIVPLNVMHQFDTMNYFTIIFSIKNLQPTISLYDDRKYEIIYPNISRFQIETKINRRLKKFIDTDLPIIYIATGSIFSNLPEYYIGYINGLAKQDCKIVIACKDYTKELKKYIKKMHIKNIYVQDVVPQKYILSKANLFITSGGQNSILESIFFQVPMLIDPISSEQRMNGLMIEEMQIGLTSNNGKKREKTTGRMISNILSSEVISNNIKKYSLDMKEHINSFDKLENYLEELKIL